MLVARVAAGLAGCFILTGCFLPGDPEGVGIGLRVDDGIISLYLPLCAGEKVAGAYLDDPRGDGKRLWHAEGPADPTSKVVQLGGTGWKKQTGSYQYGSHELSMGVDGPKRSYGAGGIDRLPTDLPPGTYVVDGEKLTGPDIDARNPCTSSQSPTPPRASAATG